MSKNGISKDQILVCDKQECLPFSFVPLCGLCVIKLSEKVDAINRLHVSTVQKRLITHENKAIKLGIGALSNLLIRNLEKIVLNNARH